MSIGQSIKGAMITDFLSAFVLGMKQFFETKSPFAYQDITARMLETVRKGYWNADQATKAKLLNEYIESINKHGVNCTDVSCGNARLLESVRGSVYNPPA